MLTGHPTSQNAPARQQGEHHCFGPASAGAGPIYNCAVEKLASRKAHNLEVAGSNPAGAIQSRPRKASGSAIAGPELLIENPSKGRGREYAGRARVGVLPIAPGKAQASLWRAWAFCRRCPFDLAVGLRRHLIATVAVRAGGVSPRCCRAVSQGSRSHHHRKRCAWAPSAMRAPITLARIPGPCGSTGRAFDSFFKSFLDQELGHVRTLGAAIA